MPLRILISPLNWGLGHATRMIPLVCYYRSKGNVIILGGNGYSLELLKNEFPDLESVSIPFTEIRYSSSKSQIFQLISSISRFCFALIKEHRILTSIVKEKKIDIVISDNRLGLFNKNAKCIILTHQVWIAMPEGWAILRILANQINHFLLRKFDECWIVDSDKTPNLAGDLSHPPLAGVAVRYIGPISRFNGIKSFNGNKIDLLIILGGPEPHRSILEKIMIAQLSETTINAVIAGGTSRIMTDNLKPNITYIPFADGNQLASLIQNAGIIICRSGYSSVMDLVVLKHSAILIPTPGQPEQEYLGEFLSARQYFLTYKQSEFELQKSVKDWTNFTAQMPDIDFNQFPEL